MEHVPCDLCGADDAVVKLSLTDLLARTTDMSFALVQCRHCGLLYIDPRPAPSEMGRFYPESYAPFARRGLAAHVRAWTYHRDVAALGPLLKPPARVLDLGCGTGELLQTVRVVGNPNVVGIEPSATAARAARERFGLPVIEGTLEDAQLPASSIDIALLSHVIEHLPSPSATLDELARVLTPTGKLVLWLPNADSFAARLLGPYWMGYDPPRHLYTFSVQTLGDLLTRHGFVIRQVQHEWLGLEWSWGLRLWARAHGAGCRTERALALLHPALTAAGTPVAGAAAAAGHSGRVRVVAARRIG